MKFAKSLLALAVVGAAFSAQAESNFVTTGNASAKLNFSVVVPRVLFLQVGTGTAFANNTTVDSVTFTVPAVEVGTANASTAWTPAASSTVNVKVLGNNGAVSLTGNGTSGGLAGTTTPANKILWSEFTLSQSNASLPNPAIGNGVAGAASALAATANVVNQTGTWTFAFKNTNVMAADTYGGQVVYTATMP